MLYDIVVFGATGFTGSLIVEYLVRRRLQRGATFDFALAGRSREKLEATARRVVSLVQAEEEEEGAAGATLPAIIVCDARNRATVDDMVAKARVIIAAAGPFDVLGESLVASCAAAGVDYCDLTGEPQFVRRMIDKYNDEAKRNGAAIVHCCGFDSLPSDLALLTAELALGRAPSRAALYVQSLRGGSVSGGTVASLANAIETQSLLQLKEMTSPTYLCDSDAAYARESIDSRDLSFVAYDDVFQCYTSHWTMAAINRRVVHRSASLRRYNSNFTYREELMASGYVKAALQALVINCFYVLLFIRPTRALLRRFLLPLPGTGPTREQMARGSFKLKGYADCDVSKQRAYVEVELAKDAGYSGTALMISEAALTLAEARAETPLKATGGGVLTPSTAMGSVLIERLRQSGMKFDVTVQPMAKL